jgi:tetratricopeptide (TPR) repeat protein
MIVGATGTLVRPWLPSVGIPLILLGFGGAFTSFVLGELRNQARDERLDVLEQLLAKSRSSGNPYSEQAKRALSRGPVAVTRILDLLDRALESDPDDLYALQTSAFVTALHLSFVQWLDPATRPRSMLRSSSRTQFQARLQVARNRIARALYLAPNDPLGLATRGILADIAGEHAAARTAFRESGQSGLGPSWHLMAATSWDMEGRHDEALRQLETAASEEGATLGWLQPFYYGRALSACGRYAEALPHLKAAYSLRGGRPELLDALADTAYHVAYPGRSAYFRFRLGVQFIVHREWRRGVRNLGLALIHAGLSVACSGSKLLWMLSKRLGPIAALHRRVVPPNEFERTMGRILMEKGLFADAQALFARALDIDDRDLDCKALLAASLTNLGRTDEAHAVLATLTVEHSSEPAAQLNASTIRLAIRRADRHREPPS